MNIQVNTDHNIEGGEKFSSYVNGVVEHAVSNFAQQITHVQVHFSDQNSSKVGTLDKRCLIEVRIAGRRPTAISHDANTVEEALAGAADKMQHSIEHTFGKLHKY